MVFFFHHDSHFFHGDWQVQLFQILLIRPLFFIYMYILALDNPIFLFKKKKSSIHWSTGVHSIIDHNGRESHPRICFSVIYFIHLDNDYFDRKNLQNGKKTQKPVSMAYISFFIFLYFSTDTMDTGNISATSHSKFMGKQSKSCLLLERYSYYG